MKISEFRKKVSSNKYSKNKVIFLDDGGIILFLPVAFKINKGRIKSTIDNSCEFYRVGMESAKIEVEYALNKFVGAVWHKGQECMYGQSISNMAKKSSAKSSYGKKPMGGKRKPKK